MTLTLAAVYAPVAFTPGRTGRLFIEFALTLAGAVLVSGFVALTLTPMMCSKLLRHQESHGRIFRIIEGGITGLERGYAAPARAGAAHALPGHRRGARRWRGGGAFYFTLLKSELSPVEDRGTVQHLRNRAGRIDARLYQPLCRAGRIPDRQRRRKSALS